MNPDKATVELVAKACDFGDFCVLCEHTYNVNTHRCACCEGAYRSAFTAGYQSALPTPTDASGLVEALEFLKGMHCCCEGDWRCRTCEVVDKALAQHREGKQWSSEVPTVPGWWWRKTEYKVEPIEVVYDLEIPAPHLWIYDGYEFRPPLEYAKLHGGQWCGPLQPPADKEG